MINSSSSQSDAQTILNQIVLDYTKEKKRQRRSKLLFRGFVLGLIAFVGYQSYISGIDEKVLLNAPHVGMVDVVGTIFDGQSANADDFAKGLDSAFQSPGLKALVLRINSPGGSPVQADYMYNMVKYYKSKSPDVKVYAVCTDICASAAYYVAAAADEIYANESSMVGSIGVLYNGFGFVGAMEKLGITRRLKTAGRYKAILDPFSPENPSEDKYLQTMLDSVHQQFIQKVKAGRGDRLKVTDDTFSGLFWTGIDAKKMGLIDGFASPGQVARDIVKIDEAIDYTYQESMFEKFAKSFGTALVNQIPEALGIRAGFQ